MRVLLISLCVFICAIILSSTAAADVPHAINYQGRLTDSGGQPVNGTKTMLFAIYDAYVDGDSLWSEVHVTVQVSSGLFTVVLGEYEPIPDSALKAPERWLQIVVGGEEISPRTELTATPYTITAHSISGDVHTSPGKLGIGLTDPAEELVIGKNITPGSPSNVLVVGDDVGTTPGVVVGASDADYGWFLWSAGYESLIIGSERDNQSGDIVMSAEHVGIGVTDPDENLVVGRNLGARSGNRVTIGDDTPGVETGIVAGADADNRGWMLWNVDDNFFSLGTEQQGGLYGSTLTLDSGKVGINNTDPSSELHVTGIAKFEDDDVSVWATTDAAGETDAWGVIGEASGATDVSIGVSGSASGAVTNWAGYFSGDVRILGDLVRSGGSLQIDHPLDPANKWLRHGLVESPDMMNIYNGNVVTNADGYAVVRLPDYFEALNMDFRYQLTVIGEFAQAIVANKIADNRFTIRTDRPNVEVSWQVTGIRQDAYANANRVQVEEDKNARERGKYAHPEAFGLDETVSIEHDRLERLRRSVQEDQPR